MLDRRVLLGACLAAAACARRVEGAYRIEVVASGLNAPWSLAFLPGGEMLVTEKFAGVRSIQNGALQAQPIAGGPTEILAQADSGLLDVVLDPRFAENRFVYLSFTHGAEASNAMAVFRARYDGGAFRDGRIIFQVLRQKTGDGHSGGRMAFLPDETLLVTTGEGYSFRDEAQNLGSHLGKVLRLDRDGRAPPDNPFQGREGALPEIYTYGHRNPLGLLVDPRDGGVWCSEMGPRGGDEINRLTPGANYGWPRTTFGTDYDGTMITPLQEAEGIEAPVVVFSPSISPSGLALYLGDAFPEWRGDFFSGSLSGQQVRRIRIQNGMAVLEEVLLHDRAQRIRDVHAGPDGYLYLLTDSDAGEVWRLRPA